MEIHWKAIIDHRTYILATHGIVAYHGKLLKEKTFTVLWLFAKVLSMKFGSVTLFGGTSKQSTKVFPVKILFSTNLPKFSPAKVSRYTVCMSNIAWWLAYGNFRNDYVNDSKSSKICPPFLMLLWDKCGEGAFAGIFNLSQLYTPTNVFQDQEHSLQLPIFTRENTYARKWGGGRLLEGGKFWGHMVHIHSPHLLEMWHWLVLINFHWQ